MRRTGSALGLVDRVGPLVTQPMFTSIGFPVFVVRFAAVDASPTLAEVLYREAWITVMRGQQRAHVHDVLAHGWILNPVDAGLRRPLVQIQVRKGAILRFVSIATNELVPLAHCENKAEPCYPFSS